MAPPLQVSASNLEALKYPVAAPSKYLLTPLEVPAGTPRSAQSESVSY